MPGTAPGDDDAAESLDDWIKRAKRAHELVDAVDLDRIAAHDQDELQKMQAVSNALEEIGRGNQVEHVEGVDEVMPELDADQQRRAELIEKLTGYGWGDRVGRLLAAQGDTTAYKPLDVIPHQEGLPEFDVCLAPESCVGNGNFGLFISHNGVFAASISEPPTKHHWRIARSRPWETDQELKQSLQQFSQQA